jgi:predicted nucleic acid-binding protein
MAADSGVVCDASVLAAVAFTEPGFAQAAELIRSRDLFAPTLLWYEVANVALKKSAARPTESRDIEHDLMRVLCLPVRLLRPAWMAAFSLAQEKKLTIYDACYLQLSLDLRVPLATLDRRLRAAADALGIGGPTHEAC